MNEVKTISSRNRLNKLADTSVLTKDQAIQLIDTFLLKSYIDLGTNSYGAAQLFKMFN